MFPGAPGLVEPVIDYALFTLAPGSASLGAIGLDAGDVFFTDFTGLFALYAPSPSLGVVPQPPGFPYQTSNVDAMDTYCAADIDVPYGVLDFFDRRAGEWTTQTNRPVNQNAQGINIASSIGAVCI